MIKGRLIVVLKMKDKLLLNVNKIHTTLLGSDRIKKNFYLENCDVVSFCMKKILDRDCNIYKKGKNFYCEIDNIRITINSYSYTIITAHIIKWKNCYDDKRI